MKTKIINNESSLTGWTEVIQEQGRIDREARQERKRQAEELISKLDGFVFEEKVLGMFDIYRAGLLESTDFCERVFKLCRKVRGIPEEN